MYTLQWFLASLSAAIDEKIIKCMSQQSLTAMYDTYTLMLNMKAVDVYFESVFEKFLKFTQNLIYIIHQARIQVLTSPYFPDTIHAKTQCEWEIKVF